MDTCIPDTQRAETLSLNVCAYTCRSASCKRVLVWLVTAFCQINLTMLYNKDFLFIKCVWPFSISCESYRHRDWYQRVFQWLGFAQKLSSLWKVDGEHHTKSTVRVGDKEECSLIMRKVVTQALTIKNETRPAGVGQ